MLVNTYDPTKTREYNQMRLRLSDIPDDTPNKEFFIGKVCDCPWKPGSVWGTPNPNSPRPKTDALGGNVYPNIHKCGLYISIWLWKCVKCSSVFYKQFKHPSQYIQHLRWVPGAGYTDAGSELSYRGIPLTKDQVPYPLKTRMLHRYYCWHCLEDLNYDPNLPRIPPLSELLPPKVIPPTLEEKLADLDARFNELFA